jgi:hypothetical protein
VLSIYILKSLISIIINVSINNWVVLEKEDKSWTDRIAPLRSYLMNGIFLTLATHIPIYKRIPVLCYGPPVQLSSNIYQQTFKFNQLFSSKNCFCSLNSELFFNNEDRSLLVCDAVWLLLRTDISEECSASIIKVTRIGKIGTTLAVTSNRRTLRRSTMWVFHSISSQRTSVVAYC